MTPEERMEKIRSRIKLSEERQEFIKTGIQIRCKEHEMRAYETRQKAEDLRAHRAVMTAIKLDAKQQRWELSQEEKRQERLEKAKEMQRKQDAALRARSCTPIGPPK
ncbi:uncharacterized protein [Diadema setosum]|uniref:uncharacterized protein n=1 Tax=Diadema setosum TaxID=31175 RepID=UPI003B3B41E4